MKQMAPLHLGPFYSQRQPGEPLCISMPSSSLNMVTLMTAPSGAFASVFKCICNLSVLGCVCMHACVGCWDSEDVHLCVLIVITCRPKDTEMTVQQQQQPCGIVANL